MTTRPAGSLPTTWELRTYDVWGNAAASKPTVTISTIEVTRARDGYPLGSIRCTSHASLSPVRC